MGEGVKVEIGVLAGSKAGGEMFGTLAIESLYKSSAQETRSLMQKPEAEPGVAPLIEEAIIK